MSPFVFILLIIAIKKMAKNAISGRITSQRL